MAQICNLLHRQIAFGMAPDRPTFARLAAASALQIGDAAECNLRYSVCGFARRLFRGSKGMAGSSPKN